MVGATLVMWTKSGRRHCNSAQTAWCKILKVRCGALKGELFGFATPICRRDTRFGEDASRVRCETSDHETDRSSKSEGRAQYAKFSLGELAYRDAQAQKPRES